MHMTTQSRPISSFASQATRGHAAREKAAPRVHVRLHEYFSVRRHGESELREIEKSWNDAPRGGHRTLDRISRRMDGQHGDGKTTTKSEDIADLKSGLRILGRVKEDR